jgi:hypothetical protein
LQWIHVVSGGTDSLPVVASRRDKQYSISAKVDADEKAQVTERAKARGMTVTQYVRDCAIKDLQNVDDPVVDGARQHLLACHALRDAARRSDHIDPAKIDTLIAAATALVRLAAKRTTW